MDELLYHAAMQGDLQSLHDIIAKDNYILDKVLTGCFKGKNPLHLATLTGQAEFVEELLKIKPKLAEVVDKELGAALHIASAKGHLSIVEALVKASPAMCMARDQDGHNPIHIAAMKGNADILEKLVQTCPLAAQVILDRGDTILHLCASYNQLGSLRLLLKKAVVSEFVHYKDANGNTILHIAVARKHFEIVKHVLGSSTPTKQDLNARNRAGCTAMDINFFVSEKGDVSIKKVLEKAGVKRSTKMWIVPPSPEVKDILETIMVVTSLFATMAFQIGVNPPGGVWQEDSKPGEKEQYRAGEAILASKHQEQYRWFMYFNTTGFFMCLTAILVLQILSVPMPKKPAGWILPVMSLLTIFTTAYTYTYSVIVISPKHLMAGVTYYSFVVVMAAFLIVIAVVLFVSCVERSRSKDGSAGEGLEHKGPEQISHNA